MVQVRLTEDRVGGRVHECATEGIPNGCGGPSDDILEPRLRAASEAETHISAQAPTDDADDTILDLHLRIQSVDKADDELFVKLENRDMSSEVLAVVIAG